MMTLNLLGPGHLDAAITVRSGETELQNTIELRAMASEIAAPKLDPGAKAKKIETLFKRHFKKENQQRQS